MTGKESLETIADTLPPWRGGRYAGKPVSIATLSNIRKRLLLEAKMDHAEDVSETVIERLAKQVPTLTQAQLEEAGNKIFSALALDSEDPETFVKISKLQIERERLQLDKAKFEEAKRRAAQADAAEGVTKSAMSPEEKDRRIREIFGLA
jgi:hypothetical protein